MQSPVNHSPAKETVSPASPSVGRGLRFGLGELSPKQRSRLIGFVVFCAVLGVVFWRTFLGLAQLALRVELHSHILLIPFVSAYLIWVRRDRLPREIRTSPKAALLFFIAGSTAWATALILHLPGSDHLSLMALAIGLLFTGGILLFFGRVWATAALFPLTFLLWAIPLPTGLVEFLEQTSQRGSAEAAELFFSISGMTYVREGMLFRLPGITLEVAQECSGIRSSLVLLITGSFAANLLLKSTWRRWLLVLLVIPLGVLRNGFRILVLGVLSVQVGPQVLKSALHHHGGPLFFALSLVPLLAVAWWLRRQEARTEESGGV